MDVCFAATPNNLMSEEDLRGASLSQRKMELFILYRDCLYVIVFFGGKHQFVEVQLWLDFCLCWISL